MSWNFWYQPFVEVSGYLGRNISVFGIVLSSQEQEIYPTTSLDENCIEFEFQMDRNYYVDLRQTYLVLKLNFFNGRGHQTYNNTKGKKAEKRQKRMKKRRRKKSKKLQILSLLM